MDRKLLWKLDMRPPIRVSFRELIVRELKVKLNMRPLQVVIQRLQFPGVELSVLSVLRLRLRLRFKVREWFQFSQFSQISLGGAE